MFEAWTSVKPCYQSDSLEIPITETTVHKSRNLNKQPGVLWTRSPPPQIRLGLVTVGDCLVQIANAHLGLTGRIALYDENNCKLTNPERLGPKRQHQSKPTSTRKAKTSRDLGKP